MPYNSLFHTTEAIDLECGKNRLVSGNETKVQSECCPHCASLLMVPAGLSDYIARLLEVEV